ncbi:DUF4157 domain-containing protein [Lusitaniella coriacea LEGE 07157]|uniref:DUF4157 domain-containing protein n=2 Tax=Lusitaniella TaxID=1983104 RepID=A0A8J7DWI5_9CYAN|nr:DUF4157 domain-containing protein [Lusitaniella coriacea LEGE 07157]
MMGNVMHSGTDEGSGSNSGMVLQTKLTIGEPGDIYEQEADRVAKQVVSQINSPNSESNATNKGIQAKAEGIKPVTPLTLSGKPKPQLQQSGEGGTASPTLETSINQAKSSGQSLPNSLQQKVGQAMGTDFSGVKVHTDSNADTLNRSLSSRAFTTGNHIFFKRGEYNPTSSGGQELITHELTHVRQQQPSVAHGSMKTRGVRMQTSQTKGNLLQRKVVEKIKIHKETYGWTNDFDTSESIEKQPGLSVNKEEKDAVDIDLAVYPHIKEEALENYDTQARTGKAFIEQDKVMEITKPPSDVVKYPEKDGVGVKLYSPTIQAIVYHSGNKSLTVHPREYKVGGKVGVDVRNIFEDKRFRVTKRIRQADPRHTSTHHTNYYKFKGVEPHDHWFKWPPSVISENFKEKFQEALVAKGHLKVGTFNDEYEKAVMEEYEKERKYWEKMGGASHDEWSY